MKTHRLTDRTLPAYPSDHGPYRGRMAQTECGIRVIAQQGGWVNEAGGYAMPIQIEEIATSAATNWWDAAPGEGLADCKRCTR